MHQYFVIGKMTCITRFLSHAIQIGKCDPKLKEPYGPICKKLKITKKWSNKIVQRTAIIFGLTCMRTAVPKKPKIAILYGRTVQYGLTLLWGFSCRIVLNDFMFLTLPLLSLVKVVGSVNILGMCWPVSSLCACSLKVAIFIFAILEVQKIQIFAPWKSQNCVFKISKIFIYMFTLKTFLWRSEELFDMKKKSPWWSLWTRWRLLWRDSQMKFTPHAARAHFFWIW